MERHQIIVIVADRRCYVPMRSEKRRHEGGGHIQKTGESNDAFGNLDSVLPRSASVFGAITVMATSGPLQEGHRKSHAKLFPSHF